MKHFSRRQFLIGGSFFVTSAYLATSCSSRASTIGYSRPVYDGFTGTNFSSIPDQLVGSMPPVTGGDFFAVSDTAAIWGSLAGISFLLGQPLVGVALLSVPAILPPSMDPIAWLATKDRFLGSRVEFLSNLWGGTQGNASLNFLQHKRLNEGILTVKIYNGGQDDSFSQVLSSDILALARLLGSGVDSLQVASLAPSVVVDDRDNALDPGYGDLYSQAKTIKVRRYISPDGNEWVRYVSSDGRPKVYSSITRQDYPLL